MLWIAILDKWERDKLLLFTEMMGERSLSADETRHYKQLNRKLRAATIYRPASRASAAAVPAPPTVSVPVVVVKPQPALSSVDEAKRAKRAAQAAEEGRIARGECPIHGHRLVPRDPTCCDERLRCPDLFCSYGVVR